MKFLLVKALLLKRAKDEGFTLPIVMAIGLVMLLLSTVNLVQSGEEQLLTLSKQGSSEALASAEFGIARYRELLNNNRVLAVYNLDQWTTTDVAGQTCDEISTNTGERWADDTSWRSISLNEDDFGVDFDGDGNIVDLGESIGEYQIVDYIYDIDGDTTNDDKGNFNLIADANTSDDDSSKTNYQSISQENDLDDDGISDARGILIVKGRSRDGSEAQIQVEIPLGVNTDDLNSLDPALWIEQSSITLGNSVNVNGSNIVLYRPAGSGGCDDPADLASQNTISDPRLLPDIIDIPNSRTIAGIISNETDPVTTDPNLNDHIDYPRDNYFQDRDGDGESEILLGTKFDDDNTNNTQALFTGADGVERYYYSTGANTDLSISSSQSILADGLGKIILHVGRNLIINTGSNAGDEVYLANSSNNGTSRYLEIHVEGDVEITGSGTAQIRGLLHVPNGTVKIRDSANVNVTGSIWANDWDNQSSGAVSITTDDYKFYSVTPNRTPKPLTYRPSNWETQEVEQ